MEIARKLLVVYFKHPHVIRKISRYGNLNYVSRRMRYAYLYIDADELKETIQSLKKIKGVARVEESLSEMETYNFSI